MQRMNGREKKSLEKNEITKGREREERELVESYSEI